MPISREVGLDLARNLSQLYTELEHQLALEMARELSRGIDDPGWTASKLKAASRLRELADATVRGTRNRSAERILLVLLEAFHRGGSAALAELGLADRSFSARLKRLLGFRGNRLRREVAALRDAIPGLDAINRLALTMTGQLAEMELPILRWVDQTFSQVVASASVEVLSGTVTRRKAAQRAWSRFLARGVTGFVDRRGRRWELASYVEMATRTATAQAAVEGHLGRLQEVGVDLVVVSNAPQECELCRPWEGKILARKGSDGPRRVRNVRTGKTETIDVEGTLREAISAGLFHPNCRHSVSAYLPGATEVPTRTADPQGDADRQQLRSLERRIRKYKLRQNAALDPETAAQAKQKVRDLQAQVRHLVANSSVTRQPNRERVGNSR